MQIFSGVIQAMWWSTTCYYAYMPLYCI